MKAKELNLGYQYTYCKNNADISFYMEGGVYFVTGFIYHDSDSFAGIHEAFETFTAGKKYFNSLKKA